MISPLRVFKDSVRLAETAPSIINLNLVDGDHFVRQACSSHRLSAEIAQLLIRRAKMDRDWAVVPRAGASTANYVD